MGVSKVENADQYKKAVKEALKYEDEIVVEQFVTGREFSVGLIGGKALPPGFFRVPTKISFSFALVSAT